MVTGRLTTARVPGGSVDGTASASCKISNLAESLPDHLAAVADKERPAAGAVDALINRQTEGMGNGLVQILWAELLTLDCAGLGICLANELSAVYTPACQYCGKSFWKMIASTAIADLRGAPEFRGQYHHGFLEQSLGIKV